jgi:BMFP domain-containing protein YqiC
MITDFGSALDYDAYAHRQESVTQVRDRLTELEARLAQLEGAAEHPPITANDNPKENNHG